MDAEINETLKHLKITYFIHLIIIIIIIIFNFILTTQIYWLKDIFKKLYLIPIYIYTINIIFPIISLIFIFKGKPTKKSAKLFKNLSLIFCIIAILFGLIFASVLMMNTIDSPEFCKECPFNLPLWQINYFTETNSNKKCNERRCAINTNNINNLEINEKNMYEYICNYDPTKEFEEVKERYIDNSNSDNITAEIENIFCEEINKDNINKQELKNDLIKKFYRLCDSFTKFYFCERSKAPNEFKLEDNIVCPENNYINKLIVYCLLNLLFNLLLAFFPWKSEYNYYEILISRYEPRRTVVKSNSFCSTINSSKIENDNHEEKSFEHSPTEIIIVYDNQDNINNNINTTNMSNNIHNNNKMKKIKKINFTKVEESSEEKIKNRTEIKIAKDVGIINNMNKTISSQKKKTNDNIYKRNSFFNREIREINTINNEYEIKENITSDININSKEQFFLSTKK